MKRIVALLAVMAVLIGTQAALAADSTVLGAYGSNSAKATIKVKSAVAKSTPVPVATQSGTLPFTGADLGVVVIAGVALFGLGFGLRRIGRNQS